MFGWHHQLNGYEFEHWEMVKDREAWHAAIHGIAESDTTEQLNNRLLSKLSLFPFAILLLSLPIHTVFFLFKKTLSENHVQLNLSHILFLRLSQKIGSEIILGSLLYGILSWITHQSAGNGPRITSEGCKMDNL